MRVNGRVVDFEGLEIGSNLLICASGKQSRFGTVFAYFWGSDTERNCSVTHRLVSLEHEPYPKRKEDGHGVENAGAVIVVVVDIGIVDSVVVVSHGGGRGPEGGGRV